MRTGPTSTFSPDEAWLPSARSRVTVSDGVARRRNPGPERHVPAVVERPDRHEHAGRAPQPGLVEAVAREARKSRGVEVDPPPGGRPRQRRLAPGCGRERGRPEGCLEARAVRAGADDDDGDRHGCHRGRGDCAESEASRRADGARGSLRLEARPQPGRSFDLVSGAAQQRDRPFLLGKSIGKDRRGVDLSLELGAAFGRERSVRERCELGLSDRHLRLIRMTTSTVPRAANASDRSRLKRHRASLLYSRGIDARLRGL